MSRGGYRIRVSGAPRRDPDPVLLAQVVILLGRHLHHQQQRRRLSAESENPGAGSGPVSDVSPVPDREAGDG